MAPAQGSADDARHIPGGALGEAMRRDVHGFQAQMHSSPHGILPEVIADTAPATDGRVYDYSSPMMRDTTVHKDVHTPRSDTVLAHAMAMDAAVHERRRTALAEDTHPSPVAGAPNAMTVSRGIDGEVMGVAGEDDDGVVQQQYLIVAVNPDGDGTKRVHHDPGHHANNIDADFKIMKREYNHRMAGEPHRTYSWHAAFVMVLLGYITTGIGGFHVYWRKDGCLLYKMTVTEGTTPGCCSLQYTAPTLHTFFNNDAARYHPGLIPTLPPAPGVRLPFCTSLHNWRDGEAKTAHIIAVICLCVWLLIRTCAVVSFLLYRRRFAMSFSRLLVASAFTGMLTVLIYNIVWSGEHLTPGPGMYLAGGQAVIDFIAYLSTLSSSVLNNNRVESHVTEMVQGFRQMPVLVKIVYIYGILAVVPLSLCVVLPWKERTVCLPVPNTTPSPTVLAGTSGPLPLACCVRSYHIFYTTSSCPGASANSVFDDDESSVVAAGIFAAILWVVAAVFWGLTGYLGWKKPIAWPKAGLVVSVAMISAVMFWGIILTDFGYSTKLYVSVCMYAVIYFLLLLVVFMRHSNQYWAGWTGFSFGQQKEDDLTAEDTQQPQNGGGGSGGGGNRVVHGKKPFKRRVQTLGATFSRKDLSSSATTTTAAAPPTSSLATQSAAARRAAAISKMYGSPRPPHPSEGSTHPASAVHTTAAAATGPDPAFSQWHTPTSSRRRVEDIRWSDVDANPDVNPLDTVFRR